MALSAPLPQTSQFLRRPVDRRAIACSLLQSMRCRIIPLAVLLSALLAGCAGPSLSPEERAALTAPARALEARGQWREAALAWCHAQGA